MRILLCIIGSLVLITSTYSQDVIDNASQSTSLTPSDYILRVVVDSLNIRELPTTDANRIGSLFEGDFVYAIGRNIDGTWFQIQRPMRDLSAGWVSREYFSYMFDATDLPITDLTTGLIGKDPVVDTGLSAVVLTESALRVEPNFNAQWIDDIPSQRTIPVLTRTPDNLWVKVNYLGQEGWVAEFLINIPTGIGAVPVDETLDLSLVPITIISPEVQRSQAERFISYASPIRDSATEIATFWSQLSEGLTISCNPPSTGFPLFIVTQQDLYELPELRQVNRLIPKAIDDLNASIEAMQRCGVFTPIQISDAYAKAINASSILSNSISTMNFVLTDIIESQ